MSARTANATDRERLVRMTRQGDTEAAQELLRLADHLGDTHAAVLAAFTLGDPQVLAARLDHALDHAPPDTLQDTLRLVGLDLSPTAASTLRADLDQLLDTANGRARLRRLSRTQLLTALARALTSTSRFAWEHAGEGDSGTTSYALAIQPAPDKPLLLVATRGGARQPSPGCASPRLRPWGLDLQKNLARARKWALLDKPAEAMLRLPLRTSELATHAATTTDPITALADAQPSRAAFETLLRALADLHSDDAHARHEHLARHLDAHWPDTERVIGRRLLARVAARPDVPFWGLVRHLDLGDSTRDLTDKELAALCHPPLSDALRTLTCQGEATVHLPRILDLEAISGLQQLVLVRIHPDEHLFAAIHTRLWPRLLRIGVSLRMSASGPRVRPGFHDTLEHARSLRALRVHFAHADDIALIVRAAAAHHLEDLEISGVPRLTSVIELLCSPPLAPRLRRLAFHDCAIDDHTALILASCRHLTALHTLELPRNFFGAHTAIELVRSPHLTALRHLDLRDAARDAEELEALVDEPLLARYESLRLRTRRRPAALATILARSPWLRIDPARVADST